MMMRWTAALFVVAMGFATTAAAAGQQCSFGWRPYSEGSVSCQSGRQFRCVNGAWQDVGTGCADEDPGDSGTRVQPGVNEPTVRDPSLNQPVVPKVNGVTQPTVP
jgi:hypothetical protein